MYCPIALMNKKSEDFPLECDIILLNVNLLNRRVQRPVIFLLLSF